MQNNTYIITFVNNTKYEGLSPDTSNWNQMPNMPIHSFFYRLTSTKQVITLTGYQAYNHLVEKVAIPGKEAFTNKVILLAKNNNQVLTVHINLREGLIQFKNEEWGKEYYGWSTKGWKEGISCVKPQFSID
jgi:hypothetical protein